MQEKALSSRYALYIDLTRLGQPRLSLLGLTFDLCPHDSLIVKVYIYWRVGSPPCRKIKLGAPKVSPRPQRAVRDERRRFTPIIDLRLAGEKFRLLRVARARAWEILRRNGADTRCYQSTPLLLSTAESSEIRANSILGRI